MTKRSYLIVCVVLIILFVAVVWWLIRPGKLPEQTVAPITPRPVVAATPSAASLPLDPPAVRRQVPGGPAEPSDPRWEERRRREKEDPGYEWKLPINFYGQVIDENERPIENAKIRFQWSNLSPEGAAESETTSDADGFFFLVDKRGNGLSLRVTKEGYDTPQEGNRFRFENARFWDANYYEPDFDHPVVIHLRKKNEAEPLIVGEARPRVLRDGTPLRLDFMKEGEVSPSGQLEIAAWLYKDDYPPQSFDWRAKLSIPGGGLREHHEEFPVVAPEDGYEPQVEWVMNASDPAWKEIVTKTYYFRFGSPPNYGRMRIEIVGARQGVEVDYWLNPSGSRNLEFDPEKRITNPPR